MLMTLEHLEYGSRQQQSFHSRFDNTRNNLVHHSGMEIPSYSGSGQNGPAIIKIGEDRTENWSAKTTLESNKNLRHNIGNRATLYENSPTGSNLVVSRDGALEDVGNWPIVTGGNGINHHIGSDISVAGLLGRGSSGQVRTHIPVLEEKGALGCVEDVDGDGDNNLGSTVLGERWEAVGGSHREDDPIHKLAQKEEAHPRGDQFEWSIPNHHRSGGHGDEGSNHDEVWGTSCKKKRAGVHDDDDNYNNTGRWGVSGGGRSCTGGAVGDDHHVVYGECQRNQCAGRGTHSVDGCGEFMPAGKDGDLALMCVACGCHRNFHQRVVLAANEDDEALRDEEKQAQAHLNSIHNIERVAHELMAAANRVIPLSQDEHCYHNLGRGRDLSIKERNTIAKISVKNLDHIAKIMLSTVECLTLLQQKPSGTRAQMPNSRDKDNVKPMGLLHAASTAIVTNYHEDPLSTDVGPISMVEKQACMSLPTPTLAQSNGYHQGVQYGRKLANNAHKSKRTRTRISMEQHDKLNAFAEKAGWTIVGQRKETIEAACQDIGIEPKTLKYWIHNSKQKWKRQPGQGEEMIATMDS